MNRDRIINITQTEDGQECIKVKHRRKSVTFLKKQKYNIIVCDNENEKND
jgi:hypothetical protein